jgi:hypothetical protein
MSGEMVGGKKKNVSMIIIIYRGEKTVQLSIFTIN